MNVITRPPQQPNTDFTDVAWRKCVSVQIIENAHHYTDGFRADNIYKTEEEQSYEKKQWRVRIMTKQMKHNIYIYITTYTYYTYTLPLIYSSLWKKSEIFFSGADVQRLCAAWEAQETLSMFVPITPLISGVK